jgi:hypothetical protein
MPMSKKNHNSPWTANDLSKLRKLAAAKLSARAAAEKIGRSTGAVKYKAMVEGIRFSAIEQPRGVQKRLAKRAKAKRR